MRFMRKWLGIDRIVRELLMLPYRGQPVIWTKRGFIVKPRTTWRRHGNR